jgi:hypothetical protein
MIIFHIHRRYLYHKNCVNAASIVAGYGLHNQGIGSSNPSRVSLLHMVQTGFGAHSASYPMGTRGFSLGVMHQEHEADHSPPSSAEVKITWIYASILPSLHGVVLNWLSTGTTLTFYYLYHDIFHLVMF